MSEEDKGRDNGIFLKEVIQALESIGGNTNIYRRRFKQGYSFSVLGIEDQIKIWHFIWKNGSSFWVRIQAYFFCESLLKDDDKCLLLWPMVKSWQDDVTGWGLCDALSKIYSRMLEITPDKVFPVLKEWNSSTDPWKRRQSVVSLIYYASVRKKILPFDLLIPQMENLLADEHYYVQKGIGWSLRELSVPYHRQCFEFLRMRAPVISSVAFSTAISKLPLEMKQQIKLLRKKNRKIM